MYEQPQTSVDECKLVLATQDLYWKYYQEVSMQCSLPFSQSWLVWVSHKGVLSACNDLAAILHAT